MTLRVVLTGRAQRDLRQLDREQSRRIVVALRRYAETDHGDITRLRGVEPPEWRLRVGDYRVRFRRRPDLLEVLRVSHRREAYR